MNFCILTLGNSAKKLSWKEEEEDVFQESTFNSVVWLKNHISIIIRRENTKKVETLIVASRVIF